MKLNVHDVFTRDGNRLYVYDVIKEKSIEYYVCLDFTQTIQKNNGRYVIGVFYFSKTNPENLIYLVDERKSDRMIEQSVYNVQNSAKRALNIMGDIADTQREFLAGERIVLSNLLNHIVYDC